MGGETLILPLPVDSLVVLGGMKVTGITSCEYNKDLWLENQAGERSVRFCFFEAELTINNMIYYVFVVEGEPDIVHFGRVDYQKNMCIDGRIQYDGKKWNVFMYHRVVIGEDQENFEGRCRLYQNEVLPKLLKLVGLTLTAIPLAEVKESSRQHCQIAGYQVTISTLAEVKEPE